MKQKAREMFHENSPADYTELHEEKLVSRLVHFGQKGKKIVKLTNYDALKWADSDKMHSKVKII